MRLPRPGGTFAGLTLSDCPLLPPMSVPSGSQWVKCHDYGNELEASIAVAVLDTAGIPAIIRSNDSVGLFGSAFQGYSAMGVSLMVPSPALAAAKTVLANARPATDGDEAGPGDDD
jgi:hypothetical protein